MTKKEERNEPYLGEDRDQAIANVQKWADEIPSVMNEDCFFGLEKHQATLQSIYEGLGIPKELHA